MGKCKKCDGPLGKTIKISEVLEFGGSSDDGLCIDCWLLMMGQYSAACLWYDVNPLNYSSIEMLEEIERSFI